MPRERTPAVYTAATTRAVLPLEISGHQGIAFDLEDGQTVRLYLDPQSIKLLLDYLGFRPDWIRARQSATSGLSSSFDKSNASDH